MLIYHPAFDAYHCLVRLLAILERLAEAELDRLRVLDFLLCFPAAVAEFRLPREAAALRSQSKLIENPYRNPIGAKRVFSDLQIIQDASVACLEAADLVVFDSHTAHVKRTGLSLPTPLSTACRQLWESEPFFFGPLVDAFGAMPLLGIDGLKSRSGLIEFRYDAS